MPHTWAAIASDLLTHPRHNLRCMSTTRIRVPAPVLLVVAVIGLLTAPVTLADRPLGIDISSYQGTITAAQWTQIYNSGRVFAWTKATEGTGYIDTPWLTNNMLYGREAGLYMGVYHFARPDLNTATAEANYFVSIAGQYITAGYLRPALDLEVGYTMDATVLSNWVNTWMNSVQTQTGVEPIIYTNDDLPLNSTVANRTLWMADYSNPTGYQTASPNLGIFTTWKFWQYYTHGAVPGITGNVDLDVFNGTMAELQTYVIPGNAQPPFVVESRSGGLHYSNYSETGTWSDGTSKSAAALCTSGIGHRWCTIGGTATAVFRFTPPATGTYEVFTTNCSTTNSGNPLVHKVTHAGGQANVNVCQNTTCSPNAANVWYSLGQYTLNANTQYTVTLDGSTAAGSSPAGSGAGRSDAIKWSFVAASAAPTITQQPVIQNVLAGETATFRVTASGDGTLSYQWQKNSVNVTNGGHYSGCTTATLVVANCDFNDAANYRCVVTNAGGSTPSNAVALTLLTPPAALYPRAIVINYDPIIETQSNKRLHSVYGWSDPSTLATGYASDLASASHNLMNTRVTQTINADLFPVKSNGFRFTDSGFMTCWSSGGCDSGGVDYRAIARDYDLARRVDAGELDEALIFGAPYFGYWESTMAGRGGFWCNSSPQVRIPCSKIFVMMGFNYERGIGEMLEDYGHRTESIMTNVYGSWAALKTHAWNRFTLYDQEMSGEAACGNVHFAPNSTSDYNWGNATYVSSSCDYWLNVFPTGYPDQIGPKRSVNSTEWGSGDMRLHHLWWLARIPHVLGSITEYSMTRLNNWWAYMQGFNNQSESGGDFVKGGSAPSATAYSAAPRTITADAVDHWSPQVNASGRMVWRGFSGTNYQIFSSNTDGTGLVQITDNAYNNEAPRINASGRIVWQAFDGQDYEIFSANSDGTNLVQITNNAYNDWHPQISNTGKIVWDSFNGTDYDIYSAAADGTSIVRITNNTSTTGYPRDDVWPQINNTNRVVWFGYSGSYWQIYSVNADGTGLVNVSNNTYDNEYPQINDSGRVVWHGWPSASDNTNCEIYSAAATGGTVTQITSNTYEDWHPQISNNGQVVWMSRPTGGKWEVHRANATGGSLTTLSPTTHHAQYPRINSSGQVVWQGFDGNDWEIYLWSGGTLYQVTSNTYDDRSPCINDNEQIVWHAAGVQGSAGDFSEIFSVSRVQTVPGDFDHDSDVDMEDFGVLQRCLGVSNPATDPTCGPADMNGDNAINRTDTNKFTGCVSGANVPGNVNCAN